MKPRQLRRAQERKTRKLELRRENSTSTPSRVVPSHLTGGVSSEPSDEYAVLAMSADTSVLIPGENESGYRDHLLTFYRQHRPAYGLEQAVVKRLADAQWRLRRLASLEAALLFLGRRKHADLFASETGPASKQALLDAHTISEGASTFKLIHSQENRLRRYYRNDLAELALLQADRTAQESARPEPLLLPDPDEIGFEFANPPDLPCPVSLSPAADCLNALPFPPVQTVPPVGYPDRT